MKQLDSVVRLFLSVDVAGSTRLKDVKNHQTLLRLYQEADQILRSLENPIIDDANRSRIIRRFVQSKLNDDEKHWADILEQTFTDFHTHFNAEVKGLSFLDLSQLPFHPWKAIGDELVYAIEIKNRLQLHELICAFLSSIRYHDKKLKEAGLIRLKGTAWTAGFPIRNREIHLPMPPVTLKDRNVDYPYPTLDFLGPDMDIGFRIAKHAWPGLLTISMDVATLLGEASTNHQVPIRHVGWDKMKGVWQDRPYPIYWARLPFEKDIPYTEYDECSVAESGFLKSWVSSQPEEAKKQLTEIEKIRSQLSPNLGVVKPYILTEDKRTDSMPGDHALVKKLISEIDISEEPVDLDAQKDTPPNDLKLLLEAFMGIIEAAKDAANDKNPDEHGSANS